ncbi:MAG: AI-2E family transporter [Clostridium sp.]|nr:AI-2E family transporter [Clostridium sp.]
MGDFMLKVNLTNGNRKCLVVVAVSFSVYLAMKYISPIASPFILAFLLAGLLNPLVQALHKKIKIRKPILAGLILFSASALAVILAWALMATLITNGGKLAGEMPDYQKELNHFLDDCCNMMEKQFGVDGVEVERFVLEQVNIFVENLEVKILPTIMGKSVDCMKNIVSFVSFFVVMFIAVLLIMKDYDKMILKLREEEEFKGVREIGKKVILYVKTFIKAQLIILCIISTVCAAALAFMGMKGGIFYGILTGVMDMLPFIGTGIMLIPLAISRLINGSYLQAVLCVCLYAVCALIREFLEPKLIGEKIGVWPVGILFAVFAGIHLFGVWGIIKGPLSLVIICETCKYLWEKERGAGAETAESN